jgi:hypothetical protein
MLYIPTDNKIRTGEAKKKEFSGNLLKKAKVECLEFILSHACSFNDRHR